MTPTPDPTIGLHHVTAIASDGPANLNFYSKILGMRLVKKTVNFDVPDTYHLYYGNDAGEPGTALTFFLWPKLPQSRPGHGAVHLTRLAVMSGTLALWEKKLSENHVDFHRETRFGEESLIFRDPDGIVLAMTERENAEADTDGSGQSAPKVLGFDGVELQVRDPGPTRDVLLGMGYRLYAREGARERLIAGGTDSGLGHFVDLHVTPDAPGARQGLGAVHHVAFRAADESHQAEFHAWAKEEHLNPSPVMDRSYFQSIYFREPNGILFEVATDQPGFTVDEPLESLGRDLKLPPPLESRRTEIEAALPPL